MWPDAVSRIAHQLSVMNGGVIGLVGLQGIGKSSALMAICLAKLHLEKEEKRKEHKSARARLELSELFPRRSDLALQAVRLLLHIQESGPQRQNQLAEALSLEPYAVSRLLKAGAPPVCDQSA